MRKLITGTNAAGRSCFVEEAGIAPTVPEGLLGPALEVLWSTGQGPPQARPHQSGHATELHLAQGAVRCLVVEHEPATPEARASASDRLHHQDALDLIVMLEGTTRMVLQDDERDLMAGDVVVMNGVDHVTVPGPEGCRMLVVSIGTPRPR